MAMSSQSNLEERVYAQVLGAQALGLIVDMDDTIFWEIDFIDPFVNHLSKLVESEIGKTRAKNFRRFFMQNWTSGFRKDLFQRCIAEFEIANVEPEVFLKEMQTFKAVSGLSLRSWAERIFSEVSIPIVILTNGNPDVQQNKFGQLNLPGASTRASLICAKDISSKPSPKAVELILDSWQSGSRDVLFVGDSEIDEQCARNSGCRFIRSI